VHEHAGDEPPPVPSQCQPTGIRTPLDEFTASGISDRDTRQRHTQKNSDVDPQNYLRYRTGESAAGPRRGHNRLNRVLGYFAALRCLMLLTPLANPLSKQEAGQLSTALCALRHANKWRLLAV